MVLAAVSIGQIAGFLAVLMVTAIAGGAVWFLSLPEINCPCCGGPVKYQVRMAYDNKPYGVECICCPWHGGFERGADGKWVRNPQIRTPAQFEQFFKPAA